MSSRHFCCLTLAAALLLASRPLAAADLAMYREVTLGASTAEVLKRTKAAERDVRTLHERPAVLQELLWRPIYLSGLGAAERDSVATILYSFVDDRLFRMAVAYDRSRTEGLTSEDMIAALSAIYGPHSTRPAPAAATRPAFDSFDTLTVLARWSQDDATIALTQSAYGGGFGLVITSIGLEAAAGQAQAAAIAMDTREAPAREAVRAKAQADAAEKTRATNKAAFKP